VRRASASHVARSLQHHTQSCLTLGLQEFVEGRCHRQEDQSSPQLHYSGFQRAASVGILNRGGRASLEEEEESWEFGDDKYAVVGCVFWASELLSQPWRPVWTWMMMCKRG
jgi:hypothetical protein